MKRKTVLLVALLGLAAAARADEPTLESVPPVVVKTVPEAGSGDVDPKTTEIRVVFSKEMQAASWSWVIVTKNSFPKTTGPAKYLADKRTNVLPVALEPGKTYAMWINSDKLTSFKDAAGNPAVPYLLVFKTRK